MELKTLKDFKEVEPIITKSGKIIEKVVSEGYASKEELKEEAIIQIKELQKVDAALNQNNKDRLVEGKICQMIFFFNIAEEDLK